jgi:hypothetical protein
MIFTVTQTDLQIIYKNSVRTSQKTHYVSARKPSRLKLFRETVYVYCENHTEHTNTLPNNKLEFTKVQIPPYATSVLVFHSLLF